MNQRRDNGVPTIKDIAQACGVSSATVSYVINGKRVLKADTRERVFRAMREMNYHPSAVARGLSGKKVHTLGVLFPVIESVGFVTNPYATGLLHGVFWQAQREGFNVTLFTSKWENAEVSAPPLRDGRTDGVLVIAPPLNSDILSGLSSLGVPVVGISAAKHAGVAVVDVDDEAGLRLATRHLIDLGHRRIAYLTGNDDAASYAPRRAGFNAAMKAAHLGIDPQWVQTSHFDGSLAFEQTRLLLRQSQPPTAIIAGNDSIALGVIEAARDAGVRVPEELSVVGFDDIPAATLVTPQLTTVHQPLVKIGEKATALLVERMRHCFSATDEEVHLLPPQLVVRGSTAQAPRLSH
ncbi:transcriptional regulator, LacI family [Abditibacterium utsteinense]|uniref:Transcriptional regulator, LacI family n=1 Tax=Abditibacterium utsteinense TaxID=1960156 RepID=A0A2S8SU47_9BACT|nr:LacI family DNA-binding transcriptional regulator [Abditibacterium utsteinense]PQV64315.1 transcriptional regulator, LacI family [Abditibacterium utsteinense]